ncbi:MAG: hypothetical protein K8R36_04220, partial [Planctomycetales bacterium]|nr:hypothetical protein [Planctomycetales bacterium]
AEVELLRDTPSTLTNALAAWQIAPELRPDLAPVVATWWQTYRDSRPPWGVALAALDEMLTA